MTDREFDLYEQSEGAPLEDWYEPEPEPDAGDSNPDPILCAIKRHIIENARTVGEMMDAANCHRLEYCEACGQLEGFRRAA